MTRPLPTDQESKFELRELFFSITDPRGIILSGNDVFCRISKYRREEIVGQPHNIIRHPDMPKQVFRILWDHIQANKPVAAYVKNMAKDGSYYWVFAVVFPISIGFLSIRLKPTSPFFKIIPDLYSTMLNVEKNAKAGWITASMDALTGALKNAGFENYESFMIQALTLELQSRQKVLADLGIDVLRKSDVSLENSHSIVNQNPNRLFQLQVLTKFFLKYFSDLFSNLAEFPNLEKALIKKSFFVINLAENISVASLNASFRSGQIGKSGATLTVLAKELTSCAGELKKQVQLINDQLHNFGEEISTVQFRVSASRLQIEMICLFIDEGLKEGGESGRNQELEKNCSYLVQTLSAFYNEVSSSLKRFVDRVEIVERQIDRMEAQVTDLEMIRKIGLMESARIGQSGEGFVSLFQEMTSAIKRSEVELNEFKEMLTSIRKSIEGTLKNENQVLGHFEKAFAVFT